MTDYAQQQLAAARAAGGRMNESGERFADQLSAVLRACPAFEQRPGCDCRHCTGNCLCAAALNAQRPAAKDEPR